VRPETFIEARMSFGIARRRKKKKKSEKQE
jgi:hypothetical protein